MTMHIHKSDYKCPSCDVVFLPYKKGMCCPNCGEVVPTGVKGYSDSIKQIADSMRIHKVLYGRYEPFGWGNGCFMDLVQITIFKVFDALEKEKPENEKEFIYMHLNNLEWADQHFLKKHIQEIALVILNRYGKEIKNISCEEVSTIREEYDIKF